MKDGSPILTPDLCVIGAGSGGLSLAAAAAAFGAYLRALGLVDAPADIEITQGSHVGRPSRLLVHIPPTGGIVVTGTATPIA